jgi:serine/threonine protein kinase
VTISEGLKDLLSRIFQVNPADRINIDGIFEHPWFQQDLPLPAAQRDYGVKEVFELENDIRAMVRSANPGFKWRN